MAQTGPVPNGMSILALEIALTSFRIISGEHGRRLLNPGAAWSLAVLVTKFCDLEFLDLFGPFESGLEAGQLIRTLLTEIFGFPFADIVQIIFS